ncbi:MAG: tail fiber protein [Bryobacteraceae bacterium]
MSTPFLGQLMLASWNYANRGFALCNGQLLPINQNQALFSLFGTMYGGDGRTNFGLPNLQGRTPISFGNGFTQGAISGTESITLTAGEVPLHTHTLRGTTTAASLSKPPTGNLLAATSGAATLYAGASSLQQMNAATISTVGGSLPHENRQPFLVMNWLVALAGVFPSQN